MALPSDSRRPAAVTPDAAPPRRSSAAGVPDPAAPRRAAPADTSPRAPVAPDDSAAARRRLEELREEFSAYEREAERLRGMLRRALGLDAPETPSATVGEGESVPLNAAGE